MYKVDEAIAELNNLKSILSDTDIENYNALTIESDKLLSKIGDLITDIAYNLKIDRDINWITYAIVDEKEQLFVTYSKAVRKLMYTTIPDVQKMAQWKTETEANKQLSIIQQLGHNNFKILKIVHGRICGESNDIQVKNFHAMREVHDNCLEIIPAYRIDL